MNDKESDTMEPGEAQYVVFEGVRLIAKGGMLEAALAVYRAGRNKDAGPIVALNAVTSELAEPDLRGGEDGIRERYAPGTKDATAMPRGRPKLGVTAREVTLLPRHWEWLEKNPAGASARLRSLVETAMRASGDDDSRRNAVEAVERFANALAGDLPNAEEASRAFYAGRMRDVLALTADWPEDLLGHYIELVGRTRK